MASNFTEQKRNERIKIVGDYAAEIEDESIKLRVLENAKYFLMGYTIEEISIAKG